VEVTSGRSVMRNLPAFYTHKLSYGPKMVQAVRAASLERTLIDKPMGEILELASKALGKRIAEIVVLILDRPRNAAFIEGVRKAGASLRMVSDGDITAAVAPSLPDSGIDLYVGIGGTPEGILTATAVRALGGDIQLRMWFKDDAAKKTELEGSDFPVGDIQRVFNAEEIVPGDSAVFCATGITDSALLPGVKLIGRTAITHSILMRARSKTVRYIRAVHDLDHKTIHLRGSHADQKI